MPPALATVSSLRSPPRLPGGGHFLPWSLQGERAALAHTIYFLPRGQELRLDAWAERAPVGKLLPTLPQALPPFQAKPREQPLHGRLAQSPPSTHTHSPSSTWSGSLLSAPVRSCEARGSGEWRGVSREGLQARPLGPTPSQATNLSPAETEGLPQLPRSLSLPTAPDYKGQPGLHRPQHPTPNHHRNQQTPETGAHTCSRAHRLCECLPPLALPERAPHPRRTGGPCCRQPITRACCTREHTRG